MALSYVVTARLSDYFKDSYLKAIEEANSGGTFKLPDDIETATTSIWPNSAPMVSFTARGLLMISPAPCSFLKM